MKTFDRFTELEVGELMTSDASADAFRMSERLLHLRRGLRALLDEDDRLDEVLLARTGLTRGDRTNGGMRR
jgi:hypothetical protein